MPILIDRFQAYVQQLTGQVPEWRPWAGGVLPGYLEQRYEPRLATLGGQTWLVAFMRQPDAPAPLQLLKQLEHLAARLDLRVAGTCLVAEHLPPYLRTRLVELGQPFVVPGRQLFWPAIGSAETVQRPQRLRPEPVATLGPVAQQLLIALLLRRVLPPLTITAVAQALGWTAASVSQAVKALEASGLVESRTEGRERIFALAGAPGEVWRQAQPLLRTPVRQRIRIRQADLPPDATLRAGESALATLSDLTEPAEPVFAVASRHWPKGPETPPVIPTPDTGTCVVELWRYPPDATATHGRVDPLSLYLSLKDAKDERLQLALERLMEQVAW
jgi:DNA-binding MarR family transcriptional regulator